MIKKLKSNKIISFLIFIICLFFIIKPSVCSKASLNGASVWAFKVFPMLFPFFILTKILLCFYEPKPNFMDKFFNKAYNAPTGSFFIFILSVLAGYPMGAKLICEQYNKKYINSIEAEKMLSFCSVSGPMFMIGTVGFGMFNSYKAGVIIFIANIIACLINGLIFKNKSSKTTYTNSYNTINITHFNIADIVYDSLNSILMVGAYIVISFILIDLLNFLKIFYFISSAICKIFNYSYAADVIECCLKGCLEITRGAADLSNLVIPLKLKTILASGIIGFGGISVLLQSLGFLKTLNIRTSKILKQKIMQGLLCIIISIPMAFLIL